MAARIFACITLLLFTMGAEETGWSWALVNSDQIEDGKVVSHESGIAFSFGNPPAGRVSISALVVDCGREHTVAGEIDTDSVHGDTFLRFPIESLNGFHVSRLTLDFGRGAITVKNPHTGERYKY